MANQGTGRGSMLTRSVAPPSYRLPAYIAGALLGAGGAAVLHPSWLVAGTLIGGVAGSTIAEARWRQTRPIEADWPGRRKTSGATILLLGILLVVVAGVLWAFNH